MSMHELLFSYSSCNSDSSDFLVAPFITMRALCFFQATYSRQCRVDPPLSRAILLDDLGLSIDSARSSGLLSSSLG